jgi:hypothetical protein
VIGPGHEDVRSAGAAGFGEAVTFSWGDLEQNVFGSLRLGLTGSSPALKSGLGLLFRGSAAVAASAGGGEEDNAPDWRHLSAGGAMTETIEPLTCWRAVLDAEDGGFDMTFTALCPPVEPGADAGALEGYEQLCAVRGTVRCGGEELHVDGLGQRGRQWGVTDWDSMELSRSVSAWLAPDAAVMLFASRPSKAKGHEGERTSAFILGAGAEGEPAVVVPVAEPRLSTVYDGEGRQLRAGMELWPAEEDGFARRAAGEAVGGTSLELGRLRLDASFFSWRMEGRDGVGRYDVWRRK